MFDPNLALLLWMCKPLLCIQIKSDMNVRHKNNIKWNNKVEELSLKMELYVKDILYR